MFGGLFYRGYKKSAWSTLVLGAMVALLAGFLIKSPSENKPGTRKKAKASAMCAEGETLNTVTGACEDESIQLTRLRKITDRY